MTALVGLKLELLAVLLCLSSQIEEALLHIHAISFELALQIC